MQIYCVVKHNIDTKKSEIDFVFKSPVRALQRANELNEYYTITGYPQVAYVEERYLRED